MSVEENKALVRRFIEEIFEEGRPDAIDELCAGPNVFAPGRPLSPDGRSAQLPHLELARRQDLELGRAAKVAGEA